MSLDTTIALTSCKRPDVLAQTLQSITARDLSAVKRIIVIEDSDDPRIAPAVAECLADTNQLFLQNAQNLGQMASVDRTYSEVDTPYIFHCEDDWLFPTSLFIDESRAVLNAQPNIHAVMLRDWNEAYDAQIRASKTVVSNIPVRVADSKDRRRWGSFPFNPGERGASDYTAHAPYSRMCAISSSIPPIRMTKTSAKPMPRVRTAPAHSAGYQDRCAVGNAWSCESLLRQYARL